MLEIERTAKRIFKEVYPVRVRSYLLQNPDFLRAYGSRTSGDMDSDRSAAMDMIECAWPIAKMVEAFDKGQSFYLVRASDAEHIWRAIEDHLNAWKEVQGRSFHAMMPPQEDMDKLLALGQRLYPSAQPFFKRADASIGFSKYQFKEGTIVSKETTDKPLADDGQQRFYRSAMDRARSIGSKPKADEGSALNSWRQFVQGKKD